MEILHLKGIASMLQLLVMLFQVLGEVLIMNIVMFGLCILDVLIIILM